MRRFLILLICYVLTAMTFSFADAEDFTDYDLLVDKLTAREMDALISSELKVKLVNDDKVAELGKKTARASHSEREYRYNFKVIDSGEVNAFATGNGSIYVYKGLLELYKGKDEELAFVLAHEVAHTALRHIASKAEQLRVFKEGKDSEKIKDGLLSIEKGFSREQEYSADRWAMLYMARAGFSPMSGVKALQTLKEAGNYTPDIEKSVDHPTSSNRVTKAFTVMSEISETMSQFEYGIMYLANNQNEEAAKCFEKFLRVFPDSKEAYSNLGVAYSNLALANVKPSDYLYTFAITKIDVSGIMLRSAPGVNKEAYDQAVEAYTSALSIDPNYSAAYSNLGILYTVAGETEKGKVQLRKAVEVNSKNPAPYNNLGYALATEGKIDEALVEFEKARSIFPSFGDALYNSGFIYYQKGQKDQAIAALKAFVKNSPNGKMSAKAREYLAKLEGNTSQEKIAAPKGVQKENKLAGITLGTAGAKVKEAYGAPEKVLAQDAGIESWEYSSKSLFVSMEDSRVARIVVGSNTLKGAETSKGVKVGDTAAAAEEKYGFAESIIRQNPYEIWSYPAFGLGFFVSDEKISKIFVNQ